MAKVSLLVLGMLVISFSEIYAQSSRDPNSSQTSTANSRTFKKTKKFSKKAYDKKFDQAIEDYVKLMDEMGELLKSTTRQPNKLMGGGIGPQDF